MESFGEDNATRTGTALPIETAPAPATGLSAGETGTPRLPWIDAARGIGIVAVVYGHTLQATGHASVDAWYMPYTWHMPFFFFLSGFVYRTQGTFLDYTRHRARQLLVPYALWLALIMLPNLAGSLLHHDGAALASRLGLMAFGGRWLMGPTIAFWFLTSLYLALLGYDALSRWAGRSVGVVCAVAYGLACLRSAFLPGWAFAWEADAVLIALPFIHLGSLARRHDWAERRPILIAGVAVFLVSTALFALGVRVPAYDIKAGIYGIPGVSLVLALAGIATLVAVSKAAGPLTSALAYAGQASLLIVVTHGALLFLLARGHLPTAALLLACLALPVALYAALNTQAWSRRYLLGEVGSARHSTPPPVRDEPNPLSDPMTKA